MKPSQQVAVGFWVLIALMIIIEDGLFPSLTNSAAYNWGVSLVLTLVVFTWYYVDTIQNEIQRPLWLNMLVILFSPFALPYYRFRYFGAKAGLVFIAITGGTFILVVYSTSMMVDLFTYGSGSV